MPKSVFPVPGPPETGIVVLSGNPPPSSLSSLGRPVVTLLILFPLEFRNPPGLAVKPHEEVDGTVETENPARDLLPHLPDFQPVEALLGEHEPAAVSELPRSHGLVHEFRPGWYDHQVACRLLQEIVLLLGELQAEKRAAIFYVNRANVSHGLYVPLQYLNFSVTEVTESLQHAAQKRIAGLNLYFLKFNKNHFLYK